MSEREVPFGAGPGGILGDLHAAYGGGERLCPRCKGSGEEVAHQPTIVDDPADITFTVCGRCQGDGTVPRMSLDRAALEHQPVVAEDLACSCGYDERPKLEAHWAFYGIKWVYNTDTGQMEWSRA